MTFPVIETCFPRYLRNPSSISGCRSNKMEYSSWGVVRVKTNSEALPVSCNNPVRVSELIDFRISVVLSPTVTFSAKTKSSLSMQEFKKSTTNKTTASIFAAIVVTITYSTTVPTLFPCYIRATIRACRLCPVIGVEEFYFFICHGSCQNVSFSSTLVLGSKVSGFSRFTIL